MRECGGEADRGIGAPCGGLDLIPVDDRCVCGRVDVLGSLAKVVPPCRLLSRDLKLCGYVFTHFRHPLFIGYEWDATGIGTLSLGSDRRRNALRQ
jgi:hypothetical protein